MEVGGRGPLGERRAAAAAAAAGGGGEGARARGPGVTSSSSKSHRQEKREHAQATGARVHARTGQTIGGLIDSRLFQLRVQSARQQQPLLFVFIYYLHLNSPPTPPVSQILRKSHLTQN